MPYRSVRLRNRPSRLQVAQWIGALLLAVAVTVGAIWMGWLPLCTKAAAISTLSLSVVLVSLVELLRRRPRHR